MKNKIFQPEVIEKANVFIQSLEDIGFFEDHDIKDRTYTFNRLCEELTQKFILRELDNEYGIFTEDEMETILSQIVVGTHLESLTKKGLIDSIINENGEEVFFLTETGKEEAKKIKER